MNQKYKKLDGTVSTYKVKNKKWIKSNRRNKPQKRGFVKQSILSTRFGFLDLFTRREQQELICPSGYSISQCFNVLRKLWFAYHKSRHEENLERMKKYADAIQKVQEDMGIKTTSFPHLGLYGDVFILNNRKGERIVCEDHSEMKKKQEEYEKAAVENARKIQEKLQKPDKEKGEEIQTFADDVSPYEIRAMPEDDEEEAVPDQLEEEKDEEAGEEVVTMTDDIPFQNQN